MTKGTIIFLNGCSSAGKTTLARRLQSELNEVYYRISADDFMDMVDREKMRNDFYTRSGEALSAMHHTVKLFSDMGLHVIVDHVLLETPQEIFTTIECVRLLKAYPVLFVKVDCDLQELERRERERGDRQTGQARWQRDHMHSHDIYDLKLDTSKQSMDECTERIAGFLKKKGQWSAFDRLYQIYGDTKEERG
ncbi:MAG: chloramphenicol phosphotransferase CPT family protein [Oscillospiraceae bacterium]|nr:chloramphenicol phosphotransferase CPT family protein [Oscillospiraceae bacterium]